VRLPRSEAPVVPALNDNHSLRQRIQIPAIRCRKLTLHDAQPHQSWGKATHDR
jgi:hypothetical protein